MYSGPLWVIGCSSRLLSKLHALASFESRMEKPCKLLLWLQCEGSAPSLSLASEPKVLGFSLNWPSCGLRIYSFLPVFLLLLLNLILINMCVISRGVKHRRSLFPITSTIVVIIRVMKVSRWSGKAYMNFKEIPLASRSFLIIFAFFLFPLSLK